jgi:hypothetical protein
MFQCKTRMQFPAFQVLSPLCRPVILALTRFLSGGDENLVGFRYAHSIYNHGLGRTIRAPDFLYYTPSLHFVDTN